jgi:hypothetical protein
MRGNAASAWAFQLISDDDEERAMGLEEKAADKKLSTVALRKGVNRKAAS